MRVEELSMTANESNRTHATRIAPALFALFGLGVIFILAFAFVHGREVRANDERVEALAIENENGDFCRGLGLVLQIEGYARCVAGLTAIRRRQEERRNAEALGIL